MKKINILIVEDSPITALYIKRILSENENFVTDIAKSGEDALQKVKQNHPDLILMDISLDGELDGIETTELVQEIKITPVIYLTANTDTETLDRAKDSGAILLMSKPFMPDHLFKKIEKALNNSH